MRKTILLVVLVIVMLSPLTFVLGAEEKTVIPDLSQFDWHKACHDILASPPKITLEWHRKDAEENSPKNEYVNVTTVIATDFKWMQYTIMENDKLVNDKTEYGQLFVKIDGKWQEVNYKAHIELARKNIPAEYLTANGHLRWEKEVFACETIANTR